MSDPIDAKQLRDESAVLARHLQTSGIEFLPQSVLDSVSAWSQKLGGTLPVPPATTSTESRPLHAEPASPPTSQPTNIPAAPSRPVRPTAAASTLDLGNEQYTGPSLALDERQIQLQLLSEQVAGCTQCPVLSECRSKTVFGEGSPQPRFAFFGEGPGADEDRTGRPFVGKAGQLLTKMIEACKLRRDDCYILNTVKCRPPGNRNPEPDEVSNCRPFFEKQLEILRPEYIVCLGAVASQSLLKSKLSVGRLRGKLHRYCDSKVLVTYHPAYLLRNPSAKKAAWQDLQIMLRDAGIM